MPSLSLPLLSGYSRFLDFGPTSRIFTLAGKPRREGAHRESFCPDTDLYRHHIWTRSPPLRFEEVARFADSIAHLAVVCIVSLRSFEIPSLAPTGFECVPSIVSHSSIA